MTSARNEAIIAALREYSQQDVARQFGISPTRVRQIHDNALYYPRLIEEAHGFRRIALTRLLEHGAEGIRIYWALHRADEAFLEWDEARFIAELQQPRGGKIGATRNIGKHLVALLRSIWSVT